VYVSTGSAGSHSQRPRSPGVAAVGKFAAVVLAPDNRHLADAVDCRVACLGPKTGLQCSVVHFEGFEGLCEQLPCTTRCSACPLGDRITDALH
jgi:hypothetical protein